MLDFAYDKADWGKGRRTGLHPSGLAGSDLVEYKLDYMTPGFIAWYESGDGSNMMGGSERMPKLPSGWAVTTLCWDGTYDISDDALIGARQSGRGAWWPALRTSPLSTT